MTGLPDRPFRYLDYYDTDDASVYFGREREIRILHTDIVVNRLVVLFARTGTGKTSLINAGVRPRLEPDYRTFCVRVEGDPLAAAAAALRDEGLLAPVPGRLPDQLRYATRLLGRPVVLFFDQFEEFFEHIPDTAARQEFVTQVAETYQDGKTEARIVFAMREEYFHEMDDFRDQVPSIFHRSSNLRLRPLTDDAARAAIAGPLERSGVGIEAGLVDRLVADLRTPAGILPAQLQIVCDTLWRYRPPTGPLTLAGYQALGSGVGDPADRIYQQRIEEDLDRGLSGEQLGRFGELMPLLRTANDTKKPAELSAVEQLLGVGAEQVGELVSALAEIGLVRGVHRFGAPHVEWTSDYLAARTDDLLERTRRLYLVRRVVEQLGTPRAEPLAVTTLRALSERVARQLTDEQLRYVLSSALYHGEHVPLWTAVYRRRGLDLTAFLEATIRDEQAPLSTVTHALRYLAVPGSAEALDLLRLALEHDSLAATAVEVIASSPSAVVVDLLTPTLRTPLGQHAVTMLGRKHSPTAVGLLGTAARHPGPVGLAAASALYRMTVGRPSDATADAERTLSAALDEVAGPLLDQALDSGIEPMLWLQQARAHGVDTWPVLERAVRDAAAPPTRAQQALLLLGELVTAEPDRALRVLESALTGPFAEHAVPVVGRLDAAQAVPLLERAVEHDATRLQAARGLYEIGRRGSDEAVDVLRGVLQTKAESLFLRAVRSDVDARFWFDRAGDYGVDQWDLLATELLDPASALNVVRLLAELCRDPTTRPRAADLLLAAAGRDDRVSQAAIGQIRDLRSPTAVELLGALLQRPDTGWRARRALQDLADDWRTPDDVVALALAIPGPASARPVTRAPGYRAPGYGPPAYRAPGYGAPPDDAPGRGAPGRELPEDGQPEDGEPVYGAPDHGAPDYGAPDYGAPDYGAPEDGAPEDGEPVYAAPDDGAPDDGAPEDGPAGDRPPDHPRPDDGGPAYREPAYGDQPGRQQQVRGTSPSSASMPLVDDFTDADWDRLLRLIAGGSCVPILGAVGAGLPTPAELARQWADRYDYPLPDRDDLGAVAQYLTVMDSPELPRELIARAVGRRTTPAIVHDVLAALPLPIYLTEGFDDLLTIALRGLGRRPRPDWPGRLRLPGSDPLRPGEPTVDEPVVYHLYGHPAQPESLVLTTDERADRHARLVERGDFGSVLPTDVRYALGSSSALLLGVDPRDQVPRLLLERSRRHVAALPRSAVYGHAPRYVSAYLAGMNIGVYWGDPDAFATELRERRRGRGS